MATLRVHDSTEYWKKTDLMVKPASYPMAVGYDVPSVDTIRRPLTLDLSEVSHEDRVYWAVRRAQDILLSSLALVVLSPLLLITYAAIWIDSPGASPIFTQQRVGRNGKLFKMYKFRTMCPDAEQKLKDLMEHNDDPLSLISASSAAVCTGLGTTPASPGWASSCARPASTSCPSSSTC